MGQIKPPLPEKANTCAVIVTYHPDSDFVSRVEAIAHQVSAVLIVDNGSNENETSMLDRIASKTKAAIIRNPKNLGVAAALNQGLDWAKERGFVWLLTMDQDTLLADSAISVFAQAVESANDGAVAIIGANFKDKLTGAPLVPEDTFGESESKEIKTLITSGSLIFLDAAQTIGKFREDFFIDYLDAEYCLRTGKVGYRILITRQTLIEHTIGLPRYHSFLGRRLITPHLSPDRRYYMSRNHIVLLKSYWHNERQWLIELTKTRIKETILILMFEDRKAIKMWNTLKGIFDGLRGRMGLLKS